MVEGTPHAGWPKGKKRAGPTASKRHGLHALKRALAELGKRGELLDESTEVGRELARWREQLVRDLGGAENMSTQESELVSIITRDKLLLESVDAWLLSQPKLVNGRKFALYPALRERMTIADGYARRLQALGLRRRERPTPSLAEYLAERERRAQAEEPAPDDAA